ncbi:MAG TPA: gephyrin-like molybdotransferase Glp [Candidatus Limnocylindrales bacterium]
MSGQLMLLGEARERVLAAIAGPLSPERVATADALGRVAAEDVVAQVALPPFDNSAMDGYAIRAADVAGASEEAPVSLRVVGESKAGDRGSSDVTAGAAVRIATGAPLPPGADAVVPVEQTTPVDADGRAGSRGRDATGPLPAACLVHVSVPVGASIRRKAEDVGVGSLVVAAGRAMTPSAIALAAGSGNAEVVVHRRPRVAVLATGDEIEPPGAPLGPGSLPDANGPGLRALVADAGAEAVDLGIARDRLEDVRERLLSGIAGADAIVVSGGVSVGPYDVVKLAFDELGRIDLWRVAVQPGKPFAFGSAAASDGRTVLLFGLPGNPVSSFVTFELFVRPAIRRLAGHGRLWRPVDRAIMTEAVHKSEGRRAFIRVVAERDDDGRPRRDDQGRVRVGRAGGQGSHVLSGLVAAEALAVIPEEGDRADAGDEVELWWLADSGA